MYELAARLLLVPPLMPGGSSPYSKEFLLELLVYRFEHRLSQLDALNDMALYPTELVGCLK